jgi:hypothetical protein
MGELGRLFFSSTFSENKERAVAPFMSSHVAYPRFFFFFDRAILGSEVKCVFGVPDDNMQVSAVKVVVGLK